MEISNAAIHLAADLAVWHILGSIKRSLQQKLGDAAVQSTSIAVDTRTHAQFKFHLSLDYSRWIIPLNTFLLYQATQPFPYKEHTL